MSEIKYWFAGSHEEFPPSELLRQAQEAERAGFDGLGCSDHFAPWFPGGQSGNAWVYLGALGQATKLPIGTGVTPVIHRYHPGVIAQAFMSLEELFPGRVWLGAGSGESLNETPLGLDWPEPDEMLERFDRGLEAIVRLWDGETVTMDGGWFRLRDALVAARLLNPDGTIQKTAHPVPGTADALLLVPAPLLPRALRERAEPWRAARPRDVGWAIAAALAARTDTLRRLGAFDPTAFLLYEDLDLCLRARASGVPVELRPEVVLRHAGGHAVNRAGEPLELHAQRRREVVRANLGAAAVARDDVAQALTFASRALVRGRTSRERRQLRALRAARRG